MRVLVRLRADRLEDVVAEDAVRLRRLCRLVADRVPHLAVEKHERAGRCCELPRLEAEPLGEDGRQPRVVDGVLQLRPLQRFVEGVDEV